MDLEEYKVKNPNTVPVLAVVYGGRDIDKVLDEKLTYGDEFL